MQIGEAAMTEGDFLSSLIKEVDVVNRKGKQRHVLIFDFRISEGKLIIEVDEEMTEKSAAKYLYIGSADGPNSPQWYATSTTVFYHLTETINNLKDIDLGEGLNKSVKQILEKYYYDLGENIDKKYRYVLNLSAFGIGTMSPEDMLEETSEEAKRENYDRKKFIDKLKNRILKSLEEYIKETYSLKMDEIGLFTLYIEGKPLAQFEEYKEAVLKSKTSNKKEKSKSKIKEKKSCSICKSTEGVTSDMAKTQIKFYTTNQLIFGSGMNKEGYDKNMLLCRSCMNKLLAGETYIKNNLDTNLAGFNVYLVPHFVYGNPLSKEDLDIVCENMKKSFNTAKNAAGIRELQNEIENSIELEDEDRYYLLNLIFYKASQKSTKLQRLIKDVHPTIFSRIANCSSKVTKLFKDFGTIFEKKMISLEGIYYLTPIRKNNKGEDQQYRELLSIYDAVFTQRKIKKDLIVSNINEAAKILYFEEQGFNIRGGQIYNKIIEGNMLIKFLEYMGCLEEEKVLDVSKLMIKEDIKNYISKMGYNEQQTALFLLGCLVGEVGNAQYSRSKSLENGETKKPILNKLNFNGMEKSRVMWLSNQILNKLRQEKLLKYNEGLYGEHKALLDANMDKWKLNKQENLFYILSGYAFATTRPMANKQYNNGGKEHEQ